MTTTAAGPPAATSATVLAARSLELGLLICAVFLLWESRAFLPLKILVVFFHEVSHALAAWLTGGHVTEMVVNTREGGHVLTTGGSRFLTLNAGYLGSLLWGLAIYRAAAVSRYDRVAMGVLAAVVALLSLLLARDLFSIVFGVATASGMLLAARFFGERVNDFLLRLIGLTSMVYVPRDIYSDTIARSSLLSDARMLAREYGGATVLWGGVWLVASIALIVVCLRGSLAGVTARTKIRA